MTITMLVTLWDPLRSCSPSLASGRNRPWIPDPITRSICSLGSQTGYHYLAGICILRLGNPDVANVKLHAVAQIFSTFWLTLENQSHEPADLDESQVD